MNFLFQAPAKIQLEDRGKKISSRLEWKNHFAGLHSRNPRLFNGPIYSVTEAKMRGQTLHLELAQSSYAHYLYSKAHPQQSPLCRSLFVCALILSKDGYYVLGEMAPQTSVPGKIQCPGGGVDKADLATGGHAGAEQALFRELWEEMGLEASSCRSVDFLCVIMERHGLSTGLCYRVHVEHSRPELEDIFRQSPSREDELSRLHFIALDNPTTPPHTATYFPSLWRIEQGHAGALPLQDYVQKMGNSRVLGDS